MNLMKRTVREIKRENRSCECCGNNDLEKVWETQGKIKRAKDIWLFPISVVVCRDCGFCFNSPAPKQKDLDNYYRDGLPGYKGIGLPYSIDVRLEVISRYSSIQGIFAEIGGDDPGEFHKRCSSFFSSCINLDINKKAGNLGTIQDLEESSVDVIAHYDVLEHITNVKEFLIGCYRALKSGGVMICEVPDIRLYPRNLLLQEVEHVNHFSTNTLSAIACQVGLRPIEFSHICSRPFGLLCVFRKEAIPSHTNVAPFEYTESIACINNGIEQIRRFKDTLSVIRNRIDKAAGNGGKVTIWGVTDLLESLLADYKIPDSAIIADSDPRRENHFQSEGISVAQPKHAQRHIEESELLVICAPRYKDEILDWIIQKTKKSFQANSLIVMGAGLSGETLR